jgi:hypothetical protein
MLMVFVTAFGPPQPGTNQAPPPSTSTQVISPVCLMSWIVRTAPGGRTIDLLVLWRGSAGWFLRGTTPSRSSGSASGGTLQVAATYGGIDVTVDLVESTRVARIGGRDVRLGDANVIFVDDTDSAAGPRVVGTTRIDPALPDGPGVPPVVEVLRRSPDVVSFLRCDVRMPGGRGQPMVDRLCREVRGQ